MVGSGTLKAWLGVLLAASLLYGLLPRLGQQPSAVRSPSLSPARPLGPLVDLDDGNCSMPLLDPWDQTVRRYLKPAAKPPDCGAKDPADGLVLFDRASGSLRLDAALHEALGRPDCRARCLRRQDDSPLFWGLWIPVRPNATLPRPCHFFHLLCTAPDLLSYLFPSIYKPVLNSVMDNLQASAEVLERQARARGRPDVVVLILDSTSLSNGRRYAPRLLALLEESFGAVVFRHHSVVGRNSRPNGHALLTGRYWEELAAKASSPDHLPFIWRNFSEAGYATIYVEDFVTAPSFSQIGLGFLSPPTDAYWRPFLLAVDEVADHSCACVGREAKLDVMLDYLSRFLRLYDNGPAFGVFWTSELTHDTNADFGAAEPSLLKFLEEHKARLQQSFLVVMGDHGNRGDPIRETEVGRKEAMLPLLALSVPKPARDRLRPVLQENSGRLTSHMDTFVTLADVLGGGWAESAAQTGWRGLAPRGGHSLIRPLPPDRSCRDAGVPADFCLCGQTADLAPLNASADAVQRAARALVQRINDRLRDLGGRECAVLRLASVRSARLLAAPSGPLAETRLVVVAEVAPSGGVFEAAVSVPTSPAQPPALLGPVDRLNAYGNQSLCEPTLELKPFCFCQGPLRRLLGWFQ